MQNENKITFEPFSQDDERRNEFIPLRIVTGRIGEEGLLPDTWYRLNEKGEFVEVYECDWD